MKLVLPLTNLRVRNLKAKATRYKVFDGAGLFLEVMISGTKSWRLKYYAEGKEKVETLGNWPDITVKQAREKAVTFKKQLASGGHPSELCTVDKLCQDWGERFLKTLSFKDAKRKTYFIERYILPAIGNLAVSELTPALILNQVLRPIEENGTIETAHKVKFLLSQILRYGVATEQAPRDFTVDLKGALTTKKVQHRPTILDKDKIGRLILDTKHYSGSPAVTYALRILLYVFVRPGELRYAEWSEINLDEKVWRIPAEKMKMRAQHLVPLSDQVIAMLTELKEHTGKGRYLFPGSRTKVNTISDAAINAALRYLGYQREEICGHGFRSMASTLLNEMGYSSDWIERQLAHSEQNSVRAAYNHAEYLPERRKMMQVWADFLDDLARKALSRK
jgi:integrase